MKAATSKPPTGYSHRFAESRESSRSQTEDRPKSDDEGSEKEADGVNKERAIRAQSTARRRALALKAAALEEEKRKQVEAALIARRDRIRSVHDGIHRLYKQVIEQPQRAPLISVPQESKGNGLNSTAAVGQPGILAPQAQSQPANTVNSVHSTAARPPTSPWDRVLGAAQYFTIPSSEPPPSPTVSPLTSNRPATLQGLASSLPPPVPKPRPTSAAKPRPPSPLVVPISRGGSKTHDNLQDPYSFLDGIYDDDYDAGKTQKSSASVSGSTRAIIQPGGVVAGTLIEKPVPPHIAMLLRNMQANSVTKGEVQQSPWHPEGALPSSDLPSSLVTRKTTAMVAIPESGRQAGQGFVSDGPSYGIPQHNFKQQEANARMCPVNQPAIAEQLSGNASVGLERPVAAEAGKSLSSDAKVDSVILNSIRPVTEGPKRDQTEVAESVSNWSTASSTSRRHLNYDSVKPAIHAAAWGKGLYEEANAMQKAAQQRRKEYEAAIRARSRSRASRPAPAIPPTTTDPREEKFSHSTSWVTRGQGSRLGTSVGQKPPIADAMAPREEPLDENALLLSLRRIDAQLRGAPASSAARLDSGQPNGHGSLEASPARPPLVAMHSPPHSPPPPPRQVLALPEFRRPESRVYLAQAPPAEFQPQYTALNGTGKFVPVGKAAPSALASVIAKTKALAVAASARKINQAEKAEHHADPGAADSSSVSSESGSSASSTSSGSNLEDTRQMVASLRRKKARTAKQQGPRPAESARSQGHRPTIAPKTYSVSLLRAYSDEATSDHAE